LPSIKQEIARRSVEREGGQTMSEYAVVLGVITLGIITSYGVLSGAIRGLLQSVVGVFS
jgi:Flp pilus assembly pilin Flp